jgi:cobalamin biosynthesis Mg chelatase CobN
LGRHAGLPVVANTVAHATELMARLGPQVMRHTLDVLSVDALTALHSSIQSTHTESTRFTNLGKQIFSADTMAVNTVKNATEQAAKLIELVSSAAFFHTFMSDAGTLDWNGFLGAVLSAISATTTQQHNKTTTQQHNKTATQQNNKTTTQPNNKTTKQQHNNIPTTQQHNNKTTTQQHNNTTTIILIIIILMIIILLVILRV